MVTNRQTADSPERREPGETADHYFELSTERDCWCLSLVMARFVESCLDERPAPEWVTFVDLHGSRVRLRTRDIRSLSELSPDQRAASRAFGRRLRRERKADPDYEADDD